MSPDIKGGGSHVSATYAANHTAGDGGIGLGIVDGRFGPCPNKPNCVSSQAGAEAMADATPLSKLMPVNESSLATRRFRGKQP